MIKKALTFFICATVTLAVGTETAHARTTVMKASWYGDYFHGKTMANGERFNMYDPSIVAHKTLPFGTKLELTNPENGKKIIVIVQDRGPYIEGRSLDLSFAGAQRLGFVGEGVISLEVSIIHRGTNNHT